MKRDGRERGGENEISAEKRHPSLAMRVISIMYNDRVCRKINYNKFGARLPAYR